MKKISIDVPRGCQLVAMFGKARLIKNAIGRFELWGGESSDVAEAREWASLFLHEAVIGEPRSCVQSQTRQAEQLSAVNCGA